MTAAGHTSRFRWHQHQVNTYLLPKMFLENQETNSFCLCWRLFEDRICSTGQVIGPPVLHRSRLDRIKVKCFRDLISSPTFPQDVAYGTKSLKRSNGEKIEIPNVVRTVVASRLIQLCQSYWKEYGFAPQGQSTLFNMVKVRTLSIYVSCFVNSLVGRRK